MNNDNKSTMDNPFVSILVIIGSIMGLFLLFHEPEPKICAKYGCDREVDKGSEYCFVHNPDSDYNAAVMEILSTPTHPKGICWKYNCDNKIEGNNIYCPSHKCLVSTCHNERRYGYSYCSDHICNVSGCERRVVDTEHQRCEAHRLDQPITNSSSHTSSSHSSNHSSSSRVEWPDCDDYEEYDEFMDDWDGNMPDGSDAEDYWYNW